MQKFGKGITANQNGGKAGRYELQTAERVDGYKRIGAVAE